MIKGSYKIDTAFWTLKLGDLDYTSKGNNTYGKFLYMLKIFHSL